MSNLTKIALSDALKEALLHKSLEKVTISELTEACGLSRMTFYYHFQDIYELAEWSLARETEQLTSGKFTTSTWEEGLYSLFDTILSNQKYIDGLRQPSTREHLERYIHHMTDTLFMEILDELSQGYNLKEDDEEFIAAFYRHAFIGVIIDWINTGMKLPAKEMVYKFKQITEGNLLNAIKKFAKNQ